MKCYLPLIVLLIILLGTPYLFATCTIDNTANPDDVLVSLNNSLAGQQFVACETNSITALQVNTSGGDIQLYLAKWKGTTSTAITIEQPNQIFLNQPAGLITLELAIPFPVIKDEIYAFALGNIAAITFEDLPNSIDPAIGSSFEVNNLNTILVNPGTSALIFGVTVAPQLVAMATIPSMGQWALFIFGLLILNLSLILLNRENVFIANSNNNKRV